MTALLFVLVALAQGGEWGPGPAPGGFDLSIDLGTGLGSGAVGAFLTTLLVGAILLALAPDYTKRTAAAVQDRPVQALGYGLVSLLVLVLLIILLFLTIVGILFLIPLVIVAYLVWAVGSALAFLAIGERLVGDRGRPAALLVGALINGGLALTGIGGFISFCIGAAGFGTVIQGWREGRKAETR